MCHICMKRNCTEPSAMDVFADVFSMAMSTQHIIAQQIPAKIAKPREVDSRDQRVPYVLLDSEDKVVTQAVTRRILENRFKRILDAKPASGKYRLYREFETSVMTATHSRNGVVEKLTPTPLIAWELVGTFEVKAPVQLKIDFTPASAK